MKRNACQKCCFAVYDDNPHCGLRGFRTSFNVERCSAENDTVPNGYELQEDGYFSWINEREYPKTYKKCCRVIGFCSDTLKWGNPFRINRNTHPYIKHLDNLIECFCKLRICRDAYWKIAGEEMGIGKPWKPDFESGASVFIINTAFGEISKAEYLGHLSHILAFPSAEMRDAFKENFKELIESCKELL